MHWYMLMKQILKQGLIESTEAVIYDSSGFMLYEPKHEDINQYEADMIAYQEYISDNYGMGYKYE